MPNNWWRGRGEAEPVTAANALPGRQRRIELELHHAVLGTSLAPPYPSHLRTATFAMGCFWGVERLFWQVPGVHVTVVGYAGGITPNPTYEEVCSGRTGHAESVMVVFDPSVVAYAELLRIFWEEHDPTQGMRQGNDVGSQYRSAIYWNGTDQREEASASAAAYQQALTAAGRGAITTEIAEAGEFYPAEVVHQQYLAHHPNGYCGLAGTGVACPIPTGVRASVRPVVRQDAEHQ